MDNKEYTTNTEKRKKGQHLDIAERGEIKGLHKQGLSMRAIAESIGCSPSTIFYELRRGTAPRTGKRGRVPSYSAKRGQKCYEERRKNCHRPSQMTACKDFIIWMVGKVRSEEKWSIDACVGYAKRHQLFPAEELVCTKTLYHWLRKGLLPISLFDVPEVLKRKQNKPKSHKNSRVYGESIENRPESIGERTEFGHWEQDTVVGKRNGRESVVFSLVEMTTDDYIAIKIPSKTVEGVKMAWDQLREQYGEHFSEVFKTVTTDNGSEFADLSMLEELGTKVYYAHPYSSWERPINERSNGLFRRYLPKGTSVERYTAEDILTFADLLNALPRKRLNYATPDELFETELDRIYVA